MQARLLLYPVADIDAALPFFTEALGLPVKFRDADRYCALDAGALTLALVAGEERLVEQPAPAFKIDEGEDIAAAMARLVAAGATVAQPAAQGPHETRAVLRTPEGFALVLSAKP
ncbi:VOC family protein [Cupriavidus neocaledonicus]|uniref:Glyoxalase/ dioxygenase n=1 Tax=Cupriavidus neocaledonicus TaxID=1040979 RepID=A0A375HRQ1_9BURK|nr:VOC family protein [Cupriavidus neocaledonicus]SOZ40067.1 putative Glyoxalase/ dioxygenase [Cupriavidus neocaledonicus]SPD60592.1 putative Glyoxalase/ dioxygenase [Cupriavidus neocaledonicus]